MSGGDFKPGTNYNRRMRGRPDLNAMALAVANQRAKCARGEHTETVAKKGYATFLGYGKRIEPGTRYCCHCQTILTDDETATAGEEN